MSLPDMKITFPKLKSLTHRSPTTDTAKSKTLNTIATDTPHRQRYLSLHERLTNLKYKYVSKQSCVIRRSPHYFKQINLSPTSQRAKEYPNQTIEHYVAEQSKMLDKEMLLELARSRVRKARQQRECKVKKEQEFIQKMGDNSMQDTKYSNFKVLRMPIKHEIRGLKHPDLTLAIRFT